MDLNVTAQLKIQFIVDAHMQNTVHNKYYGHNSRQIFYKGFQISAPCMSNLCIYSEMHFNGNVEDFCHSICPGSMSLPHPCSNITRVCVQNNYHNGETRPRMKVNVKDVVKSMHHDTKTIRAQN